MKVSRTAAVLCAVAVASVSASANVKTETEAGNNKNGRALRGGADHGKTAKKKHPETKKRALKAKDEASSDEATGTGGENRAFTTGATASTSYNNQAVASTYQQGSNAGYGNNKYGYLDRYEQYLTPEQLQAMQSSAKPLIEYPSLGLSLWPWPRISRQITRYCGSRLGS